MSFREIHEGESFDLRFRMTKWDFSEDFLFPCDSRKAKYSDGIISLPITFSEGEEIFSQKILYTFYDRLECPQREDPLFSGWGCHRNEFSISRG